MALAVNGSGTIFKKCDRSNHRPDSNKHCASSACQHTCDSPEKCSHAWTLRYWVNGKQVEKSFRDKQNPSNGRVDYGSGRKLARDWQLKVTVDKRSGDIAFTDHSKSGKQNFGEACELFIARLPVLDASKRNYLGVYRTHVRPVFGDMTLAQVANDRDGVMDLLAVKMKHLGNTARQQARYVIVAALDEAVKAGKLSKHRLDGIELADHGRYSRKGVRVPHVRAGKGRSRRRCQPGDQARRGRRRTVRLAHAWLRASHRRSARGVARGLHRGRQPSCGWRGRRRETARGGNRSSTARQASTATCPCLPGCGRWSRTRPMGRSS